MKRLILATVAVATMAAPMMTSTAYARDGDRGRDGWNDRRDHDRYDRRDNRRGDRWDRRDNRRGDRWDRGRHNGYMYQGRWHYGPPPAAYYGRPGFYVDYRQWRRGDRLPAYYRNSYRPVDYRHYGYRAPPRGYHYVRDDRGDVLLVAIATGIIASIILNN